MNTIIIIAPHRGQYILESTTRKFFFWFSFMWPIPARRSPVMESWHIQGVKISSLNQISLTAHLISNDCEQITLLERRLGSHLCKSKKGTTYLSRLCDTKFRSIRHTSVTVTQNQAPVTRDPPITAVFSALQIKCQPSVTRDMAQISTRHKSP